MNSRYNKGAPAELKKRLNCTSMLQWCHAWRLIKCVNCTSCARILLLLLLVYVRPLPVVESAHACVLS